MKERGERLTRHWATHLLLILLFALILRLVFFVGIGFNDDSYYLELAEKVYKGFDFSPPMFLWGVRIGVYLPIAWSWELFGVSELSTSFFSLIYSLGIVLTTYLIGKELFGSGVGLIAAFLISVFPLDVIYSTQIGPDGPFSLFLAVSLLFFLRYYRRKKKYELFLSGLSLGVAYLFKGVVWIAPACMGFYVLFELISQKPQFGISEARAFPRELVAATVVFLFGFSIAHGAQNVYLYKLTDQWFFGEKARESTLKHDGNKNDDFSIYPRGILNIDRNRYEWVHNYPQFGFTYHLFFLGVVALILQRKFTKGVCFLVLWMGLVYFFYQYGLHFISTQILEDGMRPRHLRFLLPMSVPTALIMAESMRHLIGKSRVVAMLLGAFFVLSSVVYIHWSTSFLRNGMGYVRETAHFLLELEPQKVYVPDIWSVSKLWYFSRYDEVLRKNLVVYECHIADCEEPSYDSGRSIEDAYIVTDLNPYTYINTVNTDKKFYPAFMTSPPSDWKLLKTIRLDTFGIFSRFHPKIYSSDP